jgi:hypothetical protein
VTVPTGGTVTVTVVVLATAANGYTNTVTLTPLAGVTNLGSTHGDGARHGDGASHAKPDQNSGQHDDCGGWHDQRSRS